MRFNINASLTSYLRLITLIVKFFEGNSRFALFRRAKRNSCFEECLPFSEFFRWMTTITQLFVFNYFHCDILQHVKENKNSGNGEESRKDEGYQGSS